MVGKARDVARLLVHRALMVAGERQSLGRRADSTVIPIPRSGARTPAVIPFPLSD
jgi:hypothetical protein